MPGSPACDHGCLATSKRWRTRKLPYRSRADRDALRKLCAKVVSADRCAASYCGRLIDTEPEVAAKVVSDLAFRRLREWIDDKGYGLSDRRTARCQAPS